MRKRRKAVSGAIKFKNRAPLLKSKVKSRNVCSHIAHKQCVLCGAVEFAIGLIAGVVLALMFARAFF